MITRRSLADEIDLIEADIKVLNDSKRDCFNAYRDQMIGAGVAKPNVKAEIDAVKAAIKRRREAAKDEHALIEKDELIDEVFHEITRAPRAHVENIKEFDRDTGEVLDRDARRRERMTESMDDHKALVDEMADAGLISEEARIENQALADAVATKFGNGPAKALQSPRQAAEAVSERTAFTDATIAPVLVEADKAEAVAGVLGQPETIPALTGQFPGVNVGGPERADVTGGESAATNSEMDRATEGSFETGSEAAEKGRKAIPASPEGVDLNHAGAGESPATISTTSDQPLEGGSHVTGSALRVGHPDPNSNNGEGDRELIKAIPGKPYNLRPNCLKPTNCAGHGSRHCHACTVAARESEEA